MKKNLSKAVSLFVVLFMMTLLPAGCGPSQSGGVATTSAVAAGAGSGTAEYNFIVSHSGTENSINQYLAQRASDLMAEKSGGRVKMTIYPNSQLGKTRESIEGMIAGNIDFVPYVSAGYVEFVKACALFDMPNVAPTLEIMRKALDGKITELMKPEFEKSGLKFFGFSDGGFRQLTSNRAVRSMADFKGLKVRVMENKNHIKYWTSLGANPTPMDYSEVFIGLQQGTIDGQENPLDCPVDMKFYEVQDYLVYTNHMIFSLIMPMNLNKFNSLPPDIQKIVEESVTQANQDTRDWADGKLKEYEKILTDGGLEVIELPDEVLAQMKDAAQSTYDSVREQVGDELVNTLLSEVDNASK